MWFPSAMPLHPSLLIWSLPVKNGKRILAFLYDRTFQQCPSIKGMGLVSEPRDLSPTAWLGGGDGVFFFFFYTFRQRGSVWNGAFSPSHLRNYSVFQGPEPVTASQPLPNHLCHVSSDREVGELWTPEGPSAGVSQAEKHSTGSTPILRGKKHPPSCPTPPPKSEWVVQTSFPSKAPRSLRHQDPEKQPHPPKHAGPELHSSRWSSLS